MTEREECGRIRSLPNFQPRQGKEVNYMERFFAFLAAVAAGVVSDRICKWLDGRRQ